MLRVEVDEEAIRELYLEAIEKHIEEINHELVFWDMKELKRRTNMSTDTIIKYFFYENNFPKAKVGTKWYFPAKETKKFLLHWLNEKKS